MHGRYLHDNNFYLLGLRVMYFPIDDNTWLLHTVSRFPFFEKAINLMLLPPVTINREIHKEVDVHIPGTSTTKLTYVL